MHGVTERHCNLLSLVLEQSARLTHVSLEFVSSRRLFYLLESSLTAGKAKSLKRVDVCFVCEMLAAAPSAMPLLAILTMDCSIP